MKQHKLNNLHISEMPSLGNTKICLDQKAGMGPENPMGLLRPDLPGYFASVKFGWQKLNVCKVSGSRGGRGGINAMMSQFPCHIKVENEGQKGITCNTCNTNRSG